jgi:hypothetical protein
MSKSTSVIPNRGGGVFPLGENLDTAQEEYRDGEITGILLLVIMPFHNQ